MGQGVLGPENVTRVLTSTFPWFVQIGVVMEPHEVNGQPGAIFHDRDGKVLCTLTLDILDGRIQAIRSVIKPGQARARRSGRGRLGGHPRGEPGSPADGQTEELTALWTSTSVPVSAGAVR